MNYTNDGSHMTWDAAQATATDGRRPPTVDEALLLTDIDDWIWTCEEYDKYPAFTAWAVHPVKGESKYTDKSYMFLAVQVWPQ